MNVFLLLSLAWVLTGLAYTADLYYTRAISLDWIWYDRGSGAYTDISIWSVRDGGHYHYSLGDLAHDQFGRPSRSSAIMVYQTISGILHHPVRFEKVWTDSGSGAWYDVAVWKMIPPAGYTCLGAVAVRSHSTQPDWRKYVCVKSNYIVNGKFIETWNTHGSGSNHDVSIWTVERKDIYGINGETFLPGSGYHQPSQGYTLRGGFARNIRDLWNVTDNAVPVNDTQDTMNIRDLWNVTDIAVPVNDTQDTMNIRDLWKVTDIAVPVNDTQDTMFY